MSDAGPATTNSEQGSSVTGIARNAYHLGRGPAATPALGGALNAVLGRALGGADCGLFCLLTSMTLFGQVIVDRGHSEFMMAEVARAGDEAGGLFGRVLVLRLVGNVVMSALTALAEYLLGYAPRTVVFTAIMVLAML